MCYFCIGYSLWMQSRGSPEDLALHIAERDRTVAENEEKLAQLFGAAVGFKYARSFIQQ